MPDRPTPQAKVRQNKPKAKSGASLKLGSFFKPSCEDPSVCNQGNSSLCSPSCRSATHDPVPQLLPSSRGGRPGSEEPGTIPPHNGEGQEQRPPGRPSTKGQKARRKERRKERTRAWDQGLQKGKAKEKGKGKAPSRVRADPTEEAHFRRLRARREAAGRSRASRTTAVAEDWNPSCLEMLGKGNWRVTYALDEGPPPGRVLKLGDHGEEEAFAKEFPLLTAQVVLVVLICLRLKGIKVRDVGVSNLAITDPSSATPPVCFFDLGSWCRAEEAKGPSWTGFWKLCDSYIPCSKDLLVAAVARNKSSCWSLQLLCYGSAKTTTTGYSAKAFSKASFKTKRRRGTAPPA